MSYPDLGDWNGHQPAEYEDAAAATVEAMAWAAIEQLTGGVLATEVTTVQVQTLNADSSLPLAPPVGGVTAVRVDGQDFAGWVLQNGTSVARLDGQTFTAPDPTVYAGVGTIEVDYYHGLRPGRLLVWAAGELAWQFYLAITDDRKCRLPKGVTSVVRQGVTFEIQTPLFSEGSTGIREIDVVLARYNPHGATSPTVIASVESLAASRTLG